MMGGRTGCEPGVAARSRRCMLSCMSKRYDLQKMSGGERFFDQVRGVYIHGGKTSVKAENYARFTSVCGNTVFWMVKWGGAVGPDEEGRLREESV